VVATDTSLNFFLHTFFTVPLPHPQVRRNKENTRLSVEMGEREEEDDDEEEES
jgi:hypothetical protein